MSNICAFCDDMAIFYVLNSPSNKIESSVLLYFLEDAETVYEDVKLFASAFCEIQEAKENGDLTVVENKQKRIAEILNGGMNASDFTKNIVQAYDIKGKKWTFVRSDKIKNHTRSYKINKNLLKVHPNGQLSKEALKEAFKDVKEKISKDLKNGIQYKSKLIKLGSFDGNIGDVFDENWGKWIDEVNDSLSASKDDNKYFDISVGAQILRAYGGWGLDSQFSPEKKVAGLALNGQVAIELASAYAVFNAYLPHRDGFHLAYDPLDMGYFRLKCEIKAQAMAGASLMGVADIEFKVNENNGLVNVLARPNGSLGVNAFAGAQIEAGVTGSLDWMNPDKIKNGSAGWSSFFSVGAGIGATAGIGAGAVFTMDYNKRKKKFMFRCKAQVTKGLGAKGEIAGVVEGGNLIEFMMFTYHQLKNNGFKFMKNFTEDAFEVITEIMLGYSFLGKVTYESVNKFLNNAKVSENYAKNIKQNIELLVYATPEAKGAILYRLTERHVFSFEEHQEAAVLIVLNTIQTQEEFEKVISRITLKGIKNSKESGLERLNKLMDGGSLIKMRQMIITLQSERPLSARPNTKTVKYNLPI